MAAIAACTVMGATWRMRPTPSPCAGTLAREGGGAAQMLAQQGAAPALSQMVAAKVRPFPDSPRPASGLLASRPGAHAA